jgi:putative sterol carrier protein
MSMIDSIFATLSAAYVEGVVDQPMTFYFSLGTTKKTVRLSPGQCQVEAGKTIETADCVCKTDPDFFISIWNDGYRPGMGDFLSGRIKSNDPTALQLFLKAFGKA